MQQSNVTIPRGEYVPGEIVRAYRRNTDSLKKIEIHKSSIASMPTCEMPVVSPYFYDTNKLVAQILAPQEREIFVERISSRHTIDLIHECVKDLVEKLHNAPRLIMLSQLRYLALGELTLQLKYYYQGIYVPFVPSRRGCTFDVRVYGRGS